jgi:hypothetical protein
VLDLLRAIAALKNVVALGAGFCDGLGMGGNTKAAIIRIGLKETIKFAKMFFSGIQVRSAAHTHAMAMRHMPWAWPMHTTRHACRGVAPLPSTHGAAQSMHGVAQSTHARRSHPRAVV